MKNKNQKIRALQQDLIKYSKQIGIIDCEIPQVAYGKKDLMVLRPRKRYPTKRSNLLGMCYYASRLIFVNLEAHKDLRQLRHTLLHELMHYRFQHISHKDLEKRMKLILKGKTYPAKHIIRPLPSLSSSSSFTSKRVENGMSRKGNENGNENENGKQEKIKGLTDEEEEQHRRKEWEIQHQELIALEEALEKEYPREDVITPYWEKTRAISFLLTDREREKTNQNLRSICMVTANPEGVYLDFKYKEDNIRPRSTFIPVVDAEDAMTVFYKVIKELMKPDARFSIDCELGLILTMVDEMNELYYRIKNVDPKHRYDIPKLINSTYPPKIEYQTLGYRLREHGRIISVDGIPITYDPIKHVYVCRKCGAIYTSKNPKIRNTWPTDDPRCNTCMESGLERICECKPTIIDDFNKDGVFVPTEVSDEDRDKFQEEMK